MHRERIASHLQGAADIRRWLAVNLPFTDSLVGHDVFVQVGKALASGRSAGIQALCAELPHPASAVQRELLKMVQAGLLVAGTSQRTLAPTPRLLALVEAYADTLDHVYAPRLELRRQLRLGAADALQRELVERMYDHFHDLGWLYLHNFGAVCFMMASLVREVAQLHGHSARVASGYLDIRGADSKIYQLGGPLLVLPGQIAGHAWCVIDECLLVDFGLGGLRRGYRRDFPWALACAWSGATTAEGIVARLALPGDEEAIWRTDWVCPDTEAEISRYAPVARQLADHYAQCFGTALAAPGDAPADSGFSALMPPPPAAQTGQHRIPR